MNTFVKTKDTFDCKKTYSITDLWKLCWSLTWTQQQFLIRTSQASL